MRKTIFYYLLSVFLMGCNPLSRYDESAIKERWEEDILQFEQLDKVNDYPASSILFAGSSSIRLWDSIATDMAPYSVIQRGYGGAALHDFAYYADRIIHPHDFKALVLFIGNDIWGGEKDKTPAEMDKLFKHIIKTTHDKHPGKPIFFIEITPIPKRWKLQKKIDAANKKIKENDYRILYLNSFLTVTLASKSLSNMASPKYLLLNL